MFCLVLDDLDLFLFVEGLGLVAWAGLLEGLVGRWGGLVGRVLELLGVLAIP